jgi:hypothetical protein
MVLQGQASAITIAVCALTVCPLSLVATTL